MYVPKTDTSIVESRPFLGNILTSDPVRYARNAAIIEAEPALSVGAPTVAWMDSAFRSMRAMRERSYPARIRQPMLIVAGGSDAVVSNPAIEDFASMLRAGSHLVIVGAQHEILMEQDRFRSQFWAAFDAFVPGTAAVLATIQHVHRPAHARACRRRRRCGRRYAAGRSPRW